MKKQYKTFVALLFVASHLLSAPLSAESSEDIIVFVNRANSVDNLTMAEVKQIFLRKQNGQQARALSVLTRRKLRRSDISLEKAS